MANKHSLEKGLYKLVDVVSDVNEFCEKTDYRVNIQSLNEKNDYGLTGCEKIIINEIVPRPIRHIYDIENLLDPFS